MNLFLTAKNNRSVSIGDIPLINENDFRNTILNMINDGKRIVSYFGYKNNSKITVYAVLCDDENSKIIITSTIFEKDRYLSMSNEIPSIQLFERELYEEFGIYPENHPWLKPVRYPSQRVNKETEIKDYPFFSMTGEEVHEVAVGPIHAGIIEPGHFRFMCHGEKVYNLEIQLGYQHRNIENLFLEDCNINRKISLAESICGDSVIGHTMCFANGIESLMGITIPRKAMIIRGLSAELERIAIHIGDLGAISNDIAYLIGNSNYGATRTIVINTLLEICGSRFGRGLIGIGKVNFDIAPHLKETIINNLKKTEKNIDIISETLFSSPSVLSRLDGIGAVDYQTAQKIGLVGFTGRASGIKNDVRTEHPYGVYIYHPVYSTTLKTGDVFARAYIRYIEIKQSINYVRELLENIREEDEIIAKQNNLSRKSMVVSMVEGWRGEIVHCIITDSSGNISRYKIKDPSFNNWQGLEQALRNNLISDFPLCNKSFNLSYCGFDL